MEAETKARAVKAEEVAKKNAKAAAAEKAEASSEEPVADAPAENTEA